MTRRRAGGLTTGSRIARSKQAPSSLSACSVVPTKWTAVPGPGRVLFQGALANFNPHAATRVDFGNDDRAPLLLIAGGADHVVPAVVDKSAADHFAKSKAVTEYREFPGRSHWTIAETGW